MKKIVSLVLFLSLLVHVEAYGNDVNYNYCNNKDYACKVCVYGTGDTATNPFKYIVYLRYDDDDLNVSYDKYSTYISGSTSVSFDIETSKFYSGGKLVCPVEIYSKLTSEDNTKKYNVSTTKKDNYEAVKKTTEFANTTSTTDYATCIYQDNKTTVQVTYDNGYTIKVLKDENSYSGDNSDEDIKRFFFNNCAMDSNTVGLNTGSNCISSIKYSNFRVSKSLKCPSQFIISYYETQSGTQSWVYGFSVDENSSKKDGKEPKSNIYLGLDGSSSSVIEAATPKFSCQYEYGTSNKSTINLNVYEDKIIASFQASYDNSSREVMVEGIEYGNDCSSVSVVYSNCLGTNEGGQCYVKKSKDSNLYYEYVSTQTTTGDQIAEGSYLDGSKYLKLLEDLKTPLSGIDNTFVISQQIEIAGRIKTLGGIDYGYGLCENSTCDGNARYQIEVGSKKIASYCNDVYKLYASGDISSVRVDECISFNKYYKAMVNKGIINDLSNDCGILSNDFLNLLRQLFTIIKIAGPIIAIFLGMLDFVKTVVSEDPEKEQKTAFKKFTKRIIAAILIFIVPTLLTFLMNLFLGGREGYNEDNPFCNIVDVEVEN